MPVLAGDYGQVLVARYLYGGLVGLRRRQLCSYEVKVARVALR